MENDTLLFALFLIFTGATALATVFLFARQSLLVVYIIAGFIFGSSGLKWITDPVIIKEISHTGIIFLLFLLGINLPANKLVHLVSKTTLITVSSSLVFSISMAAIAMLFGYSTAESLLIGAALMFSSTIIGLKLLPTTVLHHRRQGEFIISILLLQDILAILVLLLLHASEKSSFPWQDIIMLFVALIGICAFAFFAHKYIIVKLMSRFDRIQEYIFLVTLGWCLGVAQLAASMDLSYEIGAFIAGVAFASNPIALFMSEVLKPLRDFFLILFFFALGADFDIRVAESVIVPAAILAVFILTAKPFTFKFLLQRAGEAPNDSREIGFRLGQASEFSLLIAVLAYDMAIINAQASYLIQVCTLITFIASSYVVVLRFPTPVAVSDKLRRD